LNTGEFFDLILASEGLICLAVPKPEGGFRHSFFETIEAAVAAVARLDANGVTVYHACSTFATKESRLQTNVAKIRSFWLDIDVGETKPYATFKDACRAVIEFSHAVGLQQPYIVKSGVGAHVYWPMDQDMDPDPWRVTADMLKAACKIWGLKADPSRTADHASVLRPVGSTHRKGEPRPVALKVPGLIGDHASFDRLLFAYLKEHGSEPVLDELDIAGERPSIWGAATNDDLTGGLEYAAKFADPIAEQCAVVGMVRDTQGNVDQPTWYHALGVIAFCEDGDEKAHAWSSGHPQYSVKETDAKLQQIRAKQSGPTSCAKLSEFQPDACAACPFWGKIKTPATLGTDVGVVQPVAQSIPSDPWLLQKAPVRPAPPTGFDFRIDPETGRQVITFFNGTDPDTGVPNDVIFCRTIFYPVSRLLVDGEAYVEFERVLPQGMGVRRFVISGSAIGKGREGCAGILGANEIVTEGVRGPEKMDSLLKRWMHQLTETANQIQSHQAFGWVEDKREFVLGDRVILPGGQTGRAILVGAAKQQQRAFEPKGDTAVWADVIDRAYNAPGQEGYQFLVALGFAAPLMHMNAEINGMTVYAHSEDSGVGKTTATRAALSAWGNWDELQLAEGKATTGSLWALMGCYKSVPVVFDELTNMDPRTASELVFSVSSGRAKQRLKSDGDLRQNNSNWRTIMLASGNNLLSEKLSQHRGNAEAEMSRLFEFTLRATDHLTPNDAMQLFPQLLDNYGGAGETFIRYVIDHYEQVKEQVRKVREALNTAAGITQKERFWSAMIASTLVAVTVCRKLGLLQFDVVALRAWMVDRLSENRIARVESTPQPVDLLGRMLADVWQGVLVTYGEGDFRRNAPADVVGQGPRGVLTGRAILPLTKADQEVLLLNENTAKEWALKKGVSAREIFTAAVAAGWCDPVRVRYLLGRGTVEYASASGYVLCWKLYPEKIGAGHGTPSIVQRFTSINGGLNHVAGSPP